MDQAGQDDGPLLKPVDLGATNPTLNILNPIAGAQFVPKQVRPNRTAKHPLSKNIQDQTKHLVPERVNVSIKATSAFVIKLFFQKKRKSYDQPVRDNLPNMNPYKHKMREPKQFSNGRKNPFHNLKNNYVPLIMSSYMTRNATIFYLYFAHYNL